MREQTEKERSDENRIREFLKEMGHPEPYYTTDEATALFNFEGFCYGVAVVIRKSDHKKGTMVWADGMAILPDCYGRLYFNFREA